MKIEKIDQIGIVIKNIDEAISYMQKIGFGPFNIITIPNQEIIYRGEKQRIYLKIALAHLGNIQLELIEARGNSIYQEFLGKCGGGLHHIGIYVDDINKWIDTFTDMGIEVIQEGEIYGVKWKYLDTENYLGYILEIIEVP